jgi:dephospho-CoA kinase
MSVILGLVGQQASGKGTVATYIEQNYNAKPFRFSQALFATLARLSLPQTRDHLIKLSEQLRAHFGETVLADALEKETRTTDAPVVIIDGVRRPEDILPFQKNPNFFLIAVTATPEHRFARARLRAEKPEEATMTYEAFLASHARSTEVTAKAMETNATLTWNNDGSFNDLYRQIDSFFADQDIQKTATL